MSQPTVVDLNPTSRRRTALPPIVHSVRQQAKGFLIALVKKLFDSTDDALFEMADRSQTDADQHLFFDSMRQIRLQRTHVIKQFVQEFYLEFERSFASNPTTKDEPDADLEHADVENLQLMANEELELTVAVSGIVSKVGGQYGDLVDRLTARLDHVCKSQSITDSNNPLAPKAISRTFTVALEALEVDIKIKIILLKLFERMVMQRLEAMYQKANAQMAEAGVLTDLDSRRPKTAKPRRPGNGLLERAGLTSVGQNRDGADAGTPAGELGGAPIPPASSSGYPSTLDAQQGGVAAEFSLLQQLLAGARPATGVNSGQVASGAPSVQNGVPANVPTARPGVTGSVNPAEIIPTTGVPDGLGGWQERQAALPPNSAPLSTNQLITLLSTLQSETISQPLDMNHVPTHMDLHSVVLNKSPNVTGGNKANAEKTDDDVISVVGMLFDYILNDRNLAIPMKALISRLQIPVVKLAVLDKQFFSKTSHPARLLLNELSAAGIGWSSAHELRRDTLYNKIESIVLSVLNGESESPSLYEELLDELREFLRRDTKRHALVEQRVLETETGKAKSRAAKETVQKLINQKASGLRLPAVTGRFVGEYWSKVLVLTAIKQGQDSSDWQGKVKALDDLLWSLQPLSDKADLQQRQTLAKPLLITLADGLSNVLHNRSQREELIASVEDELRQAMQHDQAFLEDDEDEFIADTRAIPDDYAELSEIRLTEPVVQIKPDITIEQSHRDLVEQLKIGGWVEILQPDKPALRCKLTTIIDPGERYMFVNRRGMKVAEYSKEELAAIAARQALTLLDESEVFDRALQAVVGNLRKMQSEPTPIDTN